jgi:[histone H3]-lysine79 N-trimethyltransferase
MLTSPTRPSALLDFLPDSSPGASSSSVAVSTRLISRYVSPNVPRRHPNISQPSCSTFDDPAQAIVPTKRKSSASASLPSKMQTLDAQPKLKRGSSSDRSRGSSRQHSPAPLQPIYRFNKSRSPSAFQISESRIPRLHWIEEDGTPGDRFLSCESVVQALIHSYKSCTTFCVPTPIILTHSALDFKNPKDPNDTSFEPHPTAYPTAELEYPNTGGCET